jgi:unsaturated chondroitin disaccharide hydrolase
VPLWDFSLPAWEPTLRDSSAAAIAVGGFQELLKHRPQDAALADATQRMLVRLCDPEYLDSDLACPGLLRNAQVGGGGDVKNVYASWGDYFLMEALARELSAGELFW